jgi:hypothetical protein
VLIRRATFELHAIWRKSWVGEGMTASRTVLSSMELSDSSAPLCDTPMLSRMDCVCVCVCATETGSSKLQARSLAGIIPAVGLSQWRWTQMQGLSGVETSVPEDRRERGWREEI